MAPLKPPRRTINVRVPMKILSELQNKGVIVWGKTQGGHHGYLGISKFIVLAMDRELRRLRKKMR